MGVTIHLDTTAAHKALDDLEERIRHLPTAKDGAGSNDPASVAQALKRYNRRNGITE